MCILFFSFGFEEFPLILANNRDEYYQRSTTRGQFHTTNTNTYYYPTDNVANGTWIGLDSGNAAKKGKFACILNFHEWRKDEQHVISFLKHCDCNIDADIDFKAYAKSLHESEEDCINIVKNISGHDNLSNSHDEPSRIHSRGDLVLQFLSCELTPEEFIEQYIKNALDHYRGFNLILGDFETNQVMFASHYAIKTSDNNMLSQAQSQSQDWHSLAIKQLSPKCIYGVSNGTLIDEADTRVEVSSSAALDWPKVRRGKKAFESILMKYGVLQNREGDKIGKPSLTTDGSRVGVCSLSTGSGTTPSGSNAVPAHVATAGCDSISTKALGMELLNMMLDDELLQDPSVHHYESWYNNLMSHKNCEASSKSSGDGTVESQKSVCTRCGDDDALLGRTNMDTHGNGFLDTMQQLGAIYVHGTPLPSIFLPPGTESEELFGTRTSTIFVVHKALEGTGQESISEQSVCLPNTLILEADLQIGTVTSTGTQRSPESSHAEAGPNEPTTSLHPHTISNVAMHRSTDKELELILLGNRSSNRNVRHMDAEQHVMHIRT